MASNFQGDTPTTADPYEYIGGGVYTKDGGGWLPKSHPLAVKYLAEQGQGQAQGGAPAAGGAAGTNTNTIPQQAAAASTNSTTPGGTPNQYATNQGTQDVTRNSYLAQATQPMTVDTRDPNFRQQADPYAAAVQRSARDYVGDQAEALGPYATGALRGQSRMASEKAGQAIGSFEAELVTKELQNKRQEKQTALDQLKSMGATDQAAALQRELAQIDAQLRRAQIDATSSANAGNLALQEKLGVGGLNLDLLGLQTNQDQFADTLGFNVGNQTSYWNNQALQAMLG